VKEGVILAMENEDCEAEGTFRQLDFSPRHVRHIQLDKCDAKLCLGRIFCVYCFNIWTEQVLRDNT
jgi:hypothetical protein